MIQLKIVNLRDYGLGKHKQIDDAPFGGGGGMIFKPEPLFDATSTITLSMSVKSRLSTCCLTILEAKPSPQPISITLEAPSSTLAANLYLERTNKRARNSHTNQRTTKNRT